MLSASTANSIRLTLPTPTTRSEIYTGAAGLSLSQALNGANTVAGFAQYKGSKFA